MGQDRPPTSPAPVEQSAGIARGASPPALRPLLQREHIVVDWRGPALGWLQPPQATVTIMIGLRGTLGTTDGAPLPKGWIGGLGGDCAAVEMSGEFSALDVQLTPLGARRVLGLPLHEIAGQVAPLEEILGEAAARTLSAVHDLPFWRDRLNLLDAFLLAQMQDAPRPSPTVVRAWSRLHETSGRIHIEQLARELGCSRRLLETQFKDDVGLSPKTVARLLRFASVRRHIDQDRHRWADIAYEHGYCDQAHLNRDFRDLAGTTPTEFCRQTQTVEPTAAKARDTHILDNP